MIMIFAAIVIMSCIVLAAVAAISAFARLADRIFKTKALGFRAWV